MLPEGVVSSIVSEVVREVLQRRLHGDHSSAESDGRGSASGKKSVLVLVTEAAQEREMLQWAGKIAALCRPILGCCYRPSGSGEQRPPVIAGIPAIALAEADRAGWIEAARSADVVAVPRLSTGILAKIAALIDDEPASGVVVHALLNGKAVAVSTSGVLPPGAQRLKVPAAIADVVSAYFRQIAKYGAHLVPEPRLHERVAALVSGERTPRKPLVHTGHVQAWADEGETRIELPPNALITPLAREEAARLGVSWTIGREDRRRPQAEEETT
jgi:hypothetical protein